MRHGSAHRLSRYSPLFVLVALSCLAVSEMAFEYHDKRQCQESDNMLWQGVEKVTRSLDARAEERYYNMTRRGCCLMQETRVGVIRGGRVYHTWLCPPDLDSNSDRLPGKREDPDEEHEHPFELLEEAAPWGLDRIDTRANSPDLLYTPRDLPSVSPVMHVFIVDTGVTPNHPDMVGFDVRAEHSTISASAVDCNGHGTHVSSIVGSKTYGVIQDPARIIVRGVRVLDCDGFGSTTTIIGGLAYAIENAPPRGDNETLTVVNLSLGGGKSNIMNELIDTAYNELGIIFVAAAGNQDADACNYSPASAERALTVGSTDQDDVRSGFSNFGPCVDLFAPGGRIPGAWPTTEEPSRTLSGTSMAAPHVAGSLLFFDPSLATATCLNAPDECLLEETTPDIVGDLQANRFLFVGEHNSSPQPPSSSTTRMSSVWNSLLVFIVLRVCIHE